MERIIKELNEADKNTREALQGIEKAAEKIEGQFHVINNIYTEGGNVTVERLGEVIEGKTTESELLKNVIKHLENIIGVKDAQIKLMLDTLTDNKTEIDSLKEKIKFHKVE